ncbi:MAG: hypothetical protein U0P45_03125 [Acidimicrobiales bacterium]
MSAPARVGASERGPDAPLHVRPPRPVPRGVLVALAVVAALGFVLVLLAVRSDGGDAPGDAWRGLPQPPRAGEADGFDGTGALDRGEGGPMRWVTADGGWQRRDGLAQPGDARTAALVDAGSVDALAIAQFVAAAPGSGLVVSSSTDLAESFELVVGDQGWRLVERSPKGELTLGQLEAPTDGVVAKLVRRGDRLEATVSSRTVERRTSVALVGESPEGTYVGLVGGGGGTTTTAVDLFGYLALPTG